MIDPGSLMRSEALEAAQVVATTRAANADLLHALVERLQRDPPQHIVTVARGSSDHAAGFFGYHVMAMLNRWWTSLPMSIVTIEGVPLAGQGVAAFAFSQSGASPDVIAPMQHLQKAGGVTVALVNTVPSALAHACDWVLPLCAGAEKSVAATKSVIAQLTLALDLIGRWKSDARLQNALDALPAVLRANDDFPWHDAVAPLANADRMIVIGRGAGLSIAQEAALKLKETCGIQAEAFSGAEFKHGPIALLQNDTPILLLALRGPAQASLLTLAQELCALGARVFVVTPRAAHPVNGAVQLPFPDHGDERLDGIVAIQAIYLFVESLARARGRNPDAPAFLSKVTKTR
jgi:glutamine---fructose-6-phosphate transaminase (isomerizing)